MRCFSLSITSPSDDPPGCNFVLKTTHKTYAYNVKNNYNVCLPDTVEIKTILINKIMYDPRVLLYDPRFNTFNYTLYIRDRSSIVSFIKGEEWLFHVKDKIKSIYYFNNISSFYPADAKTWNYLDNLSKENEQLHSLISKWKK